MNDRNLTAHAQARKQQRGISQLQIELIELFGEDQYQKGGSFVSSIPDKKLRELRNALDKLSGVSMIKGNRDQVITCQHNQKRINATDYVA